MTPQQIRLLKVIRSHNKHEAKEFPEYIKQNQAPVDISYWSDRNVTTADEFKEYQRLIENWSDMMKDMNGFRPRADILTLERLRFDWEYIRGNSTNCI